MKNFWTMLLENPAIFAGLVALLANAITGVVVVVKTAITKIKKGCNVVETIEISYLKLKEHARNCIYEKEKLFASVPSFNGLKTGVFKLDSVLKEIEAECLRKGVEYDSLYWTEYVNTEVANMKGVK